MFRMFHLRHVASPMSGFYGFPEATLGAVEDMAVNVASLSPTAMGASEMLPVVGVSFFQLSEAGPAYETVVVAIHSQYHLRVLRNDDWR